MNLTNILPFWNSLDSVRRVHSDLEFAAIICFALLAFFDVLAHRANVDERERLFGAIGLWFFGIAVSFELLAYPYGQRNDTLSEQIIGSLSIKAKDASDNADKAVGTSSTALTQASDALTKTGALNSDLKSEQTRLTELDAKRTELAHSIDDLSERIRFRHVSPDQSEKIRSALLLSSPGTVEVEVTPNAEDGDVYCRELWKAISGGGWRGSFGMTTLLYSGQHDLLLIMKEPNTPPSGEVVLRKALDDAGIKTQLGRDPRLGVNDLILLVAPKPK